MAMLALLLGIGAIAGSIAMLMHKDWLKGTSRVLHTRVDPKRYSVGYNATRTLVPPVMLIWGVLMVLYGLSVVL